MSLYKEGYPASRTPQTRSALIQGGVSSPSDRSNALCPYTRRGIQPVGPLKRVLPLYKEGYPARRTAQTRSVLIQGGICSSALHSLPDMFVMTATRLLWKAFSHAAIIERRLFVLLEIIYSFIQLSELGVSWMEQTGVSWMERTGVSWSERTGVSWRERTGVSWRERTGVS